MICFVSIDFSGNSKLRNYFSRFLHELSCMYKFVCQIYSDAYIDLCDEQLMIECYKRIRYILKTKQDKMERKKDKQNTQKQTNKQRKNKKQPPPPKKQKKQQTKQNKTNTTKS